MNLPLYDADLQRIECVFNAIAQRYSSRWKQYLALAWVTRLYCISVPQFRKAFELWVAEQAIASCDGGEK
ncbi:MAG: hypothetical protein NVS2B14_01200 [Chamaesiphon sp.]